MKKIDVSDKTHIKQLLYTGLALGVKNDSFSSFGGFQLWWYEKNCDICYSCHSSWTDGRKMVAHQSLDKAAKVLWHHRKSLFLRNRQIIEDQKLHTLEQL